jgi:tetratricopeptide (TPR) repeat protein
MPNVFERFPRAKELVQLRSLAPLEQARHLLWMRIAENPNYAPAWAWLGRCSWRLAKLLPSNFSGEGLTPLAFRRAFLLDPELAVAHQFFTPYQLDTGKARDALTRLRRRFQRCPSEPETVISLVQVLRFRGLLDESLEFHKRAIELDPIAETSVPHTHFFRTDYRASIETYGRHAGYYLDAADWAALGDTEHASGLLNEMLSKIPAGAPIVSLMASQLGFLNANYGKASELIASIATSAEPEGAILLARHCAQMGMADQAVKLLNDAAAKGFVCAPEMLRNDPWFKSVRNHRNFTALLESACTQVRDSRAAWNSSN